MPANDQSLFDPLWTRVADPLRRAIIEGALPPGELLSENRLAAEYGVSRTPVREALRLLMEEELVEMLPGRKVRVAVPRVESVREIYDVRLVLESEAVRRLVRDPGAAAVWQRMDEACTRSDMALDARDLKALAEANEAFHAALVSALGNGRLLAQYRAVHNLITLYRHQSLHSEGWAEDGTAEHRPLLEHLRERDEAGALDLLRRHIEHARDVVCRRLGSAGKDTQAA
ncbi:GntR family transcriptional regulator [Microbacteriaceae bacterium K1510]|nr:GntR family transcriptional regulator [Microbacteriaceae bacterium K1510]